MAQSSGVGGRPLRAAKSGGSLTGFLGVAIAAVATVGMMMFSSGPVEVPRAIAQEEQQTVTPPPQTSRRKRHEVNLSVSTPDDIKVKAGDRVTTGQVLADRTREREKLTAQRRQLELAITRLMQPITPPPPPPEPSYAGELAAIDSAREAIAYYEQLPEPEFRFKDQGLVMAMDADRVAQRQEVARQRMEAQQILNGAIANLTEAKSQHQRDLYNYQVSLLQAENEQRDREVEALKLTERLEALDKQIEELTAVRSPYDGRVRRVEIVSQNNLAINATIHLLVRENDEAQ